MNIPFNEYLFGSFYKGSITHHYYSIFVPNDTNKIIIQLEGNYLDGFIGEGITKLNTIKELDQIINLNIINETNVIELTKDNLNFDFRNRYISLAFRSKNFFEDIFSFYNFRILYLKKDEELYYPLDSNFGNLCLAKKVPSNKEPSNNKYYCNFILSNNYNELSSYFSITGANQVEYFRIRYAPIYKDNNNTNINFEYKEFKYIFNMSNMSHMISHFIFRFEYDEPGIKNILSTFNDKSTDFFLQIYSSQIFYLYNITKVCHYYLKHNYTLNYKWINGYNGICNFNLKDLNFTFFSRNFRGKPVGLEVSEKTTNMTFIESNFSDYVFYMQLKYNIRNKGIEEVISGETKSELMVKGHFPLYYFIKLKNKENVCVDINIRLNSFNVTLLKNEFEIKGYFVDENIIKSKIRGEYIDLNEDDAVSGIFIESYKFGFLQMNTKNTSDKEYILISITNKYKTIFDSLFLVEIINNEYSKEYYFMPINQYIFETFDINETSMRIVNLYSIDTNDMMNNESTILVEFSPNYNDITLNFENNENITYNHNNVYGFQKYRISPSQNKSKNESGVLYFNINNTKNRPEANYIIRYYYTEENLEYNYIFDSNYNYSIKENDGDSGKVSVNLTFNNIAIVKNNKPLDDMDYNITFYIYAFLFPRNETKEEELVNTSSLIHTRHYLYKTEISSVYSKNEKKSIILMFKDISKKDNYLYDLQLKVNVYIGKSIFNEEFLTYTINNVNLIVEEKSDTKNDDDTNNDLLIVILCVIVFVIIGIIVIAVVVAKYKKEKKELKEKVLSIGYTAGIEKNILAPEGKSKKDEDYESTFI